jgi:hypothetical protein
MPGATTTTTCSVTSCVGSLDRIRELAPEVEGRLCVDSAPIMDKGVGGSGRDLDGSASTPTSSPRKYGSWVFLGELSSLDRTGVRRLHRAGSLRPNARPVSMPVRPVPSLPPASSTQPAASRTGQSSCGTRPSLRQSPTTCITGSLGVTSARMSAPGRDSLPHTARNGQTPRRYHRPAACGSCEPEPGGVYDPLPQKCDQTNKADRTPPQCPRRPALGRPRDVTNPEPLLLTDRTNIIF